MDNVKIGQLILRLRKENNMTQLQLADLVLHTPRLVLSEPMKTALSIRGLNLGIFYNKNILSDNLQVKTTQHYIIRCMLCGFFIIQHLMRMFYC